MRTAIFQNNKIEIFKDCIIRDANDISIECYYGFIEPPTVNDILNCVGGHIDALYDTSSIYDGIENEKYKLIPISVQSRLLKTVDQKILNSFSVTPNYVYELNIHFSKQIINN